MQAEAPAVLDQREDEFPDFIGDASLYPTVKSGPKDVEDQDAGLIRPMVDPFDTTLLGSGIPNYALDPASLGGKEFPPLATQEELDIMAKMYAENPVISGLSATSSNVFYQGSGKITGYKSNEDWIQTHSGRRFNPLNPNPDAIVIQDIAHALSMQCRFSGHCKQFYSVAQHSVLVSYICDSADALWGLLHDASEAYLVDVPRPLKRSGKFDAYIDFEQNMQAAICKRFGLTVKEPPSVKKADTTLLATEARDLMSPLHPDWKQPTEPLPFKIEAWGPEKAKDMFMKRFFELTGSPGGYEHYLMYRDQL